MFLTVLCSDRKMIAVTFQVSRNYQSMAVNVKQKAAARSVAAAAHENRSHGDHLKIMCQMADSEMQFSAYYQSLVLLIRS